MLLSDFKFAYALGPATFPSLAMAIQYIQVALLQLRIREQEIMCRTFLDATALYKLWRHAGRVCLAQEHGVVHPRYVFWVFFAVVFAPRPFVSFSFAVRLACLTSSSLISDSLQLRL